LEGESGQRNVEIRLGGFSRFGREKKPDLNEVNQFRRRRDKLAEKRGMLQAKGSRRPQPKKKNRERHRNGRIDEIPLTRAERLRSKTRVQKKEEFVEGSISCGKNGGL